MYVLFHDYDAKSRPLRLRHSDIHMKSLLGQWRMTKHCETTNTLLASHINKHVLTKPSHQKFILEGSLWWCLSLCLNSHSSAEACHGLGSWMYIFLTRWSGLLWYIAICPWNISKTYTYRWCFQIIRFFSPPSMGEDSHFASTPPDSKEATVVRHLPVNSPGHLTTEKSIIRSCWASMGLV